VTYFNKEGQNEYRWNFSTSPKINLINLHKWLVLEQGRESIQDGGVAKESNCPISRSPVDDPFEYTQFSIESNIRTHTTYVWDTLRNTWSHTPSILTHRPSSGRRTFELTGQT
jgi:hypothetical protein